MAVTEMQARAIREIAQDTDVRYMDKELAGALTEASGRRYKPGLRLAAKIDGEWCYYGRIVNEGMTKTLRR